MKESVDQQQHLRIHKVKQRRKKLHLEEIRLIAMLLDKQCSMKRNQGVRLPIVIQWVKFY